MMEMHMWRIYLIAELMNILLILRFKPLLAYQQVKQVNMDYLCYLERVAVV